MSWGALALGLVAVLASLLLAPGGGGARFAGAVERRGLRPRRGSLPLGVEAVGPWQRGLRRLAAPPGDSVLVVGPTGSGKTTSLLVPAILSWEGPALVASVKDDILRTTGPWRRGLGPVEVLAPEEPAERESTSFDPVALVTDHAAARRVAAALVAAASSAAESAESEFWGRLATKQLAGLLLAASRAGGDVALVARWLDDRAEAEPLGWLGADEDAAAAAALRASFAREERQASSVAATAESVIEPLLSTSSSRSFDPDRLLGSSGTLYLCAPMHEQRRYRSLFSATTSELLRAALLRARREGGRLERPLLVVLDEAASIAPLAELDSLAATCGGHGVTLVTCFQDLAQIEARWGARSATIVNNHRTRVLLGGLADPAAASLLAALGGRRSSKGPAGEGREGRALVEADDLRRMPGRSGLVISGSLRVVRLRLQPWWGQRPVSARGRR